MSVSERNRLEVFGRVKRGEMTVVSAAALMRAVVASGPPGVEAVQGVGRRCRAGAPVAGSVEQSAYERGIASADREAAPGALRGFWVRRCACEKLAEEALLVSPDTLVAIAEGARIVGSAASPTGKAPQTPGASLVPGIDGADGWQPPRLVRGSGGQMRADGGDRRRDQSHLCPLLRSRDDRGGV